jgi:phosphatidylethanolamine-binding protein (PEBP) family uncharacterized protein
MIHIDKAVDYRLLHLSSTAFKEGGLIPAKYTCDGVNINPALDIIHIPEEAKSLALIVDDPDAPFGTWVHWVVWNIPVTHHIKENEVHGTMIFSEIIMLAPARLQVLTGIFLRYMLWMQYLIYLPIQKSCNWKKR